MEIIEKKEEVFQTKKGRVKIYDALLYGEPCYMVYHEGFNHTEIISHDNDILKAVINRANYSSLSISEVHRFRKFFFRGKGKYRKISLRGFVFCKYHGLRSREIKNRRIDLKDSSLREKGIIDLRKENLYYANEENTEGVRVICNPNNSSEKYILINRDNSISIQDYSPFLYDIITHRKNCHIAAKTKTRNRQVVIINVANGTEGYLSMSFSRFVLIYYMFISRFKNMRGCTKRFIGNVPLLNKELGEGIECGHINAESWNNCLNNIMPMQRTTNMAMKDYYKDFVGDYNLFAITVMNEGEQVILVDFSYNGTHNFWICKSPEEYADLQKIFSGHSLLTKNTTAYQNGSIRIDTPKEELTEHGRRTFESTEDKLAEFWNWCNKRDTLIRLFNDCPKLFKRWYSIETNKGKGDIWGFTQNLLTFANSNQCQVVVRQVENNE